MNDVRTRTVVCCYRGKVGTDFIAFSAEYTLFNNCNFNLVYRYSLSVNLTLFITV
jgi:hypothetical protein